MVVCTYCSTSAFLGRIDGNDNSYSSSAGTALRHLKLSEHSKFFGVTLAWQRTRTPGGGGPWGGRFYDERSMRIIRLHIAKPLAGPCSFDDRPLALGTVRASQGVFWVLKIISVEYDSVAQGISVSTTSWRIYKTLCTVIFG